MEFHQPYTVSSFFYYDLNETGEFEASTTENTNSAYAGFYRLSYFKNYVSTVKSILNKYFPINYANMGINDVIFPLTSSGYYRDFTVGDLEMDLNSTPFVMSTGAQNYKNMVIMPNKTVQLKDMALAVQSTTNFSLTVYVKYHTTSGWASWGTGGATTDMYNVGTYSMKKGTYNPMSSTANDFSIDMANILKTAQINGVTKNNCVINPFLNNTESYDSSTLLTLSYDGSTHFKPIQNSTNEIDNIDYVDSASEYVEIIFEASPEVLYQLGVLMFYFDIV